WDGGAEHYRLARFRDFRKWSGSAFLQRPAFPSQSQTMGPAFDQPDTKATLKFRDPARQRGLGTARNAACPTKTAMGGDQIEVGQSLQIHGIVPDLRRDVPIMWRSPRD